MHTIWKFEVPPQETFTANLPKRARFLDVQVQKGAPWMWFLLDPEAEKIERKFVVLGTGHPAPEAEKLTHLGTFQIYGGDLVLHVFEYDALAAVRS